MYPFFHEFQLTVMLFLSGACGVLALLSMMTETITKIRKRALVAMEIAASLLLLFERQAYLYRGGTDWETYYMVRISNFMVFFLTLVVAHTFNLYLMDLFKEEKKLGYAPKALVFCEGCFTVGAFGLFISQFTGWYYTFNEINEYQRGSLFILCYVMPILMTTIQLVVILKYRKLLTKMEFLPVFLFAVIPYGASIAQIFLYGLSLTSISLVGMAVTLYFFEIVNINTLEEQRKQAEEANTAKSRFLTNISHELRTPINTIMGMGEMISREDATKVPHDYYQHVNDYARDIRIASESLLGLVNDILDISEIEAGQVFLDEHPYEFKTMMNTLIATAGQNCQLKGLRFEFDIDEQIPSKFVGDEPKIRRTLHNLLTNAVRFTQDGSVKLTAEIVTRRRDTVTLAFRVIDTGVGLKKEDIDKLFTAFDSLDTETTSKIEGTGLGLDISKVFTDLMGGDISCESEYGRGTTFTLILPQLIEDENPVGKITGQEDTGYKGAYIPHFIAPDISVLAVDDNPMNLSVIKGLLAPTRMLVSTAESGREALSMLEDHQYNIILLDHMMPEMDGIETLEHIRVNYPDLPVIALTANYISNGVEFYTSKGFNGYLPKPVDGETLEKAVRQFLPNDLVMDVSDEEIAEMELGIHKLPEEYQWLNDVPEINVEDGLKFSGGADGLIFSLKMFLETMDDNIKVLKDSFDTEDFKLYTVKVHALKSSARIIGAGALSEEAKALEDAGKAGNIDFIIAHNEQLIHDYEGFKEILKPMNPREDTKDKPLIDKEELAEAFSAMKELVSMMDFDAMEMVIGQVREYRLEDADEELMKSIEKNLRIYDWDKLEELLKDV